LTVARLPEQQADQHDPLVQELSAEIDFGTLHEGMFQFRAWATQIGLWKTCRHHQLLL